MRIISILAALCCLLSSAVIGEEPASAQFATSSGRQVFWRGEAVGLSLSLPLSAPHEITLAVCKNSGEEKLLYRGIMPVLNGKGTLHLLVPTDRLGAGIYTFTANIKDTKAVGLTTSITLRESTVTSPGMIIDESSSNISASSKIARQTGMINFMTDGRFNVTDKHMSENTDQLNTIFDKFADQQMLFWNQDASRPFSFYPPHSTDNTDGEYLRRMIIGNTVMMRYPSFAGQLFDYDPTGFIGHYNGLVTYWGWGNDTLRQGLKSYLEADEKALYDNFRKLTGKEPLTAAESLQLAVALHVPEAMGYIDLPSRRWAEQIAARGLPMEPAQLAKLKERAFAWYGYLMTLNQRRYANYVPALRAIDPTLTFSTSNTINHSRPRDGAYHAASYQPLDFRYVAVWDDQGGAPEHIYETALAATLLNANRASNQPLWIDTVFGLQNGNHFRNAILLAGRGAQGTGYAMEMGSNLTGPASNALKTNEPMNQEIAQTGKFFERFGGLFANAQRAPKLGLLYSKQQCIITPYSQSYVDGMVKAIYLLSHIGLPPELITEEMLEKGVPEGIDAIVVLRQSESLPQQSAKGLKDFAARGGRVIADANSTVNWDYLERSSALDLPFFDLGHPYNAATAYNRQDATIGEIRALAAQRCPQLRALLQGTISQLPLDATNPDVAVSTLQGGAGQFVAVANDSMLDFSAMFTKEQQSTLDYQRLFVGHGIGAIGSWMPLKTELLLSPALGQNTAVYDLFTMSRLPVTRKGGARIIPCDMTGAPGRLLAVYPVAVGNGKLEALQTVNAGDSIAFEYRAADIVGKPVEAVVPVKISMMAPDGSQKITLYRATDAQGILRGNIPTGACDVSGTYTLQVQQLLDGGSTALPVKLKVGSFPTAIVLQGAQVRDPQTIKQFFASKPEIVIPVFDNTLLSIAKTLAAGLVKQGVAARVWENPPVVNYTLGYAVSDEERPNNEKVLRGEAIGDVQFRNMVNHVNGNFYGSAMTGYRYGKHIILLGIPGKNRILDGVKSSGLLWTDRATDEAGGALVQELPWALGLRAETIVVQGADLAGLESGAKALLNLPASDAVTDGVRKARSGVIQGHGVPLTHQAAISTQKLTTRSASEAAINKTQLNQRDFSMVSVTDVQEMDENLVVTLARFGNSVAVVNKERKAIILPAISSSAQAHCGKSIIVTATAGMTFAWSVDGQPLWRAMGNFKCILPGTDDVLIESDEKVSENRMLAAGEAAKLDKLVYCVTPAGESNVFTFAIPQETRKPELFTAMPIIEKYGHDDILKGIKVTDTRNGQEIKGLKLSADKAAWNLPYQVRETLNTGGKGDILLVFRRYPGENVVQIYQRATGKVISYSDFVQTDYLTDAAVSTDETVVALCGAEGTVRLIDPNGKIIASVKTGAFPRLFPLQSGFLIGTADGRLFTLKADGKLSSLDLLAASSPSPDDEYRVSRMTKLITWSNPSVLADKVPLNKFYWYLLDADGTPKMINFAPGTALDFRWLDIAQGMVNIPAAKPYTLTIRAAAKYFDDAPLAQSSWGSILEMRGKVIKNERPAPSFRIWIDGKTVANVSPKDGFLQPFVTPAIKEGWAILKPKDNEYTTFITTIDLPAGTHQLGIQPVNMEDCFMTSLEVKD
ncbi:MAG: hypothetical protein WCO98_00640 [bacterium]